MANKNQEKIALVTGACGFSAGHTIDLLLKEGWKVKGTDLDRSNRKSLDRFGDQIDFVAGDITDPNSLKNIIKDVDVVFHTAAIFDFSAPLEVLRAVNVQGTKNVIELSMKAGVQKVILWSSVMAYGFPDPKYYKIPITEDQPLNPTCKGYYDLSKREQEQAAINYYKENNFPISVMRCGALYGPRTYYGVYTFFKYIKQGSLMSAPGNLHKVSMPLVHAEDISLAAIFLSDAKKFNGETYNITDDNDIDLIQTCKFIAANTNSTFGVTIPLPMKVLKPLFNLMAKISVWSSKRKKKKVNGKSPIPKMERDLVNYLYGDFNYSNGKIKNEGFLFKYGDRRLGLIETLKWYDEHGWKPTQHL
jgi:nucleoside-diphosphate-sugar epimerase